MNVGLSDLLSIEFVEGLVVLKPIRNAGTKS
jgi:antitoxin ChpS